MIPYPNLVREEALPYDYMHVKIRDLLCLMLIEDPETRVDMENVNETIGSMTKAGQTFAYGREDEFVSVYFYIVLVKGPTI